MTCSKDPKLNFMLQLHGHIVSSYKGPPGFCKNEGNSKYFDFDIIVDDGISFEIYCLICSHLTLILSDKMLNLLPKCIPHIKLKCHAVLT